MNKKILKKLKKIRLLISDVDGVLTDGGMYYSEKGEIIKKFNTRDGMAVELLHKFSIKTIFLTQTPKQFLLLAESLSKKNQIKARRKENENLLIEIPTKHLQCKRLLPLLGYLLLPIFHMM